MTSTWVKKLRRAMLAFAAVVAISAAPAMQAATPASAAVSGFNAGNIIDDALFYDGAAMSASEIQVFLNQKLSTCRIGTAPYIPGWPSPSGSGNIIASNCLKDFRQTTTSRVADRYCQGYVGAPNETAAQIIAKVAKSCSISPKVLLVMLEKEQSLVTDSWPVTRQYNYALGMNCPDSGPGGSANCDAASAGFSLQLYLGARQLQVYKGNPGSFNFMPGRINTIQWHPNAGCGTSQVYIENWATASLYIYTPYRPNQAALDAGWGTGDGCSSYGNRNFYLFYTSWFGSTRGFSVWGDIGAYWTASGGGNGVFGYPTSNSTLRSTEFANGSWVQSFSGGVITTEMNTGKTVGIPFGRVYDNWNLVEGGLFGQMGAPIAEPANYTANGGGVLQWFQGGLMVTAVQSGTVASLPYGRVYDLYNTEFNGIYGELGYPTSSMTSYQGGKLQNFQNGFISQASGADLLVPVTRSGFFDYYNGVAGGIYGKLGFPTGKIVTDQNGVRTQEFAGGFLMQNPGGTVIEISGPSFTAYREAAENGVALGAPVSSERTVSVGGGASYVQFQYGLIVTPKSTNKPVAIGGASYEHYNSVLGGFGGTYGYPISNQRNISASGGGTLQAFQRGYIIESTKAQTVAGLHMSGPVFSRYNGTEDGIYGWLGLPVSDLVQHGAGVTSQTFLNGGILADGSGKITVLPSEAFSYFIEQGHVQGALGAQVSPTRSYDAQGGGSISFFENGLVTTVKGTKETSSLKYGSKIYERYNGVENGVFGWLGFPVADETAVGGLLVQTFQHGTIGVEPNGNTVSLPTRSYEAYRAEGGSSGALGLQNAASRKYAPNGGAWLSFFSNAIIIERDGASGSVATMRFDSPIYEYYNVKADGIFGSLGYPIANEVSQGGVLSQQFQNGTLTYSGGVVTRS